VEKKFTIVVNIHQHIYLLVPLIQIEMSYQKIQIQLLADL
jgi:hypothetical protein